MRSLTDFLWGVLTVTVSLVLAVAIYAAFILVWVSWQKVRDGTAVEVCQKVRVGMPFAQVDQLLHDRTAYYREFADFDRNEYIYSGVGGSCEIGFDDARNRVTSVHFETRVLSFWSYQ